MRLNIQLLIFCLIRMSLLSVSPLLAQMNFSEQLKKKNVEPYLPKMLQCLPMTRVTIFQIKNLAPTFDSNEQRIFWQEEQNQSQNSLAFPIVGGLVGGAAGFFGGALLGYAIETSDCGYDDEFCGLGGAILGAAIGESIFMPIGVHVGNRPRGDLAADFLVSLAIGAAGIGVAAATDSPNFLIAVPLFQLGATVAVERNTGTISKR